MRYLTDDVVLFPLKFLYITGTFVSCGSILGALMGILGVPEDGVPRGLASGVNGPYMHTRTSLKKVKCLGCHVLLIIDSESQSRICIGQK